MKQPKKMTGVCVCSVGLLTCILFSATATKIIAATVPDGHIMKVKKLKKLNSVNSKCLCEKIKMGTERQKKHMKVFLGHRQNGIK